MRDYCEGEEMTDDNVIKAKFDGVSLSVKDRNIPTCLHGRVWVDEEARKVTCRDCERQLDPISVLLSFARKERNFQYTKESISSLRLEIDELKKEERRIKARIRTAKKK